MKVLLAQINTVVGDFEGNVTKILSACRYGWQENADLIVFPELTVTGYPPMDLLERSAFIEANLRCIEAIKKETKGRGGIVVVGFAEPNRSKRGKPLYNAAAVIQDGAIVGVHRKVLLPTYDVFDEARYFEPGPRPGLIQVRGRNLAVTICEDIWSDKPVLNRILYRRDPVACFESTRPDLVVNLSASPFVVGKLEVRLGVGKRVAARLDAPLVYVNLVGGNDGLIFDGESFAVWPHDDGAAVCAAFREETALIDIAHRSSEYKITSVTEMTPVRAIVEALKTGIRDFCHKQGFREVLVGLSGGIDSAVVAALATRALGPQSVIAVTMPSRYTSSSALEGARTLAKNLGIRLFEVPIDKIVDAFIGALKHIFGDPPWGVTEENIQARVRGTLLMAFSNKLGALVLNTGNKSEMAVGYCTLYGDMVGGLAVIGDLTKQMVYEVARELNREKPVIPEDTLTRPPSAELRPNQKDEDTLPPYPILDAIVRAFVEENLDAKEIVARGFSGSTVGWVLDEIAKAEFKRRQAPVALKISPRAFGVGRRFPIVQRFRDRLGGEREC